MSFTENDRNFRSEAGKTFPHETAMVDATNFVDAVAFALRQEFGSQPAAVKSIARLLGANERAVRNWFEGKNGPNGEHLVGLMRHSDAVMTAMLHLSRRDHSREALAIADIRVKLSELLILVEGLEAWR